jgi:DNA-binding PadR family transcriptional regulator
MVALSTTVNGETSETRVIKKIQERIAKSFMDIFIMQKLKTEPSSGYDIIKCVHGKFGFFPSSGTVYSLLYSLERNGLIEASWFERKRVYKLTYKGAKTLEITVKAYDKIKDIMNILIS